MRQTLTLIVAMMASFPLWAQSSRVFPADKAQELQPIQRSLVETPQAPSNVTAPGTNLPVGTVTTDVVTAIKIGESSNAFTFVTGEQSQVTAVQTAGGGTVGFIYRQNINSCGGQTAENGLYRMTLSTDGGNNWNVGNAGISNASTTPAGCYGIGPINPVYSQQSRYPSLLLSLPGTSTAIADLIAIYNGPVLEPAGTGWNGIVAGVVQNPAGAIAVTDEAYYFQNNEQYFNYSLTERVPGEYWYLAWDFPAATVGTTLFANKGVYNATTGKMTWSVAEIFDLDYVRYFPEGGTDSVTARTSPLIAFSPDGMTGYISINADINDRDSVFLPVMIRTTDGGLTWEDPFEVKLSSFNGLKDLLKTFWIVVDTATGDTLPAGNGTPTTSFDHDLVVDKHGNFHYLTVVANSSNRGPSGIPNPGNYAISSGLRMFVVDVTPDAFGDPNVIVLSPQATFRGTFGAGTGDSDQTTADPWLQASRTVDGSKVFFSWTESDTTGNFGDNDNSNPNQITVSLDVDNMKLSPVVNWTRNDANWVSRAVMPKVSPVAISNGTTHTIPTVIMDLSPNTTLLNPVSFWYFSDVSYDNADYTIDAEFFYNCKENPFSNVVTPVAPGCGLTDGSISVAASGGLGSFTYSWDAAAGSVTTATASNLGAGIYEVTITDSVGCSDVQTIILNDANAPTLVVDSVVNITCFGQGNGKAGVTATPVGTANIASYLWSNGETTPVATGLPAGTSTLIVTDDLNCQVITTVSIDEPSDITVSNTTSNVSCFGDTNGSATTLAFGGTGMLSYEWEGGITTPGISDLAAGTYTLTVTDENGCTKQSSITITEPAELLLTTSTSPNTALNPTFTGFATAASTGGTDPVEYTWTGPGGFTGSSTFIFGLNAGIYVVTATDANGCVTVDTAIVGGVNSIAEELASGITSMKIFPNPNNGVFTVNLELDRTEDVRIEVLNMNGQAVEAIQERNALVVNHNFNLTAKASGIYFIQVTTSRGTSGRRVVLR